MIVRHFEASFPVVVPPDAHTLTGFRAWAVSDGFPEHGKVSLINGELLIDMSPERVESHNQVKTEIIRVVSNLVRQYDLGRAYSDGVWITNDAAQLSTEPDAAFARWSSLEEGRVQVVSRDNQRDGIELRGTPDWVLEVVSDSSLRKDTRSLPIAYYQAGVQEYWLVDARGEELQFTIFTRGASGFEAVQPRGQWHASPVFGRQFYLERQRDRVGGWQYTLHAEL